MATMTTTFTEARKNFASTWDQALSTGEPIVITRNGSDDVVLLSRDKYRELTDPLSYIELRQRDLEAISAIAGTASDIFGGHGIKDLSNSWD